MTIALRTRRTIRILTVGRHKREPGKVIRHAHGAECGQTGRVLSAPGFVYCALYGGAHGADSRLTVNGRGFGRRVIPER